MTKTLHILNGDCTLVNFKNSNIKGDTLIWREMLCEGNISNDIGSDDFWKNRYAFFETNFNISKLDYYDKTLKEIIKLEDLSHYSEVVLWFEYDLFCQINLLAACTFLLKSFRKNINYHLICTGKEKGKSELQTLTDYDPSKYKLLFDYKLKITRNNLLFAEKCWYLFVENNREKLKLFDFNQSAKFIYLQLAIDQHLKRFSDKNGLNQIEYKILNLINSGLTDRNKIIKQLLIWQKKETVYGFGDMQYGMIIKNLKTYYFDENNVILLNHKGKELI